MTALFEAGAGMLNLAAASNFIETRGETNEFGGIAYRQLIDSIAVSGVQISFGSIVQLRPIAGLAIVWDTVRASDKSVGVNCIVWDTLIQGNAIVWDTAFGPTAIVWDTAVGPSAIVWDTAVSMGSTNGDD